MCFLRSLKHFVSLRRRVPLLRVRTSDRIEPRVAGMESTNFPGGPLRIMASGSTPTLTSCVLPTKNTAPYTYAEAFWVV